MALRDRFASGGLTEIVVVDPARAGLPLGARRLVDHRPGGQTFQSSHAPLDWPPLAVQQPSKTAKSGPWVHAGLAFLPIPARIRLVIVGAGHVGQAVADLASRTGFQVTVADDRGHYANLQRFPAAHEILTAPFEALWATLRESIDEQTYVLVVTRGHGHDQEALAQLAPTSAAYVGLIGSKRKIKMIFQALEENGIPRAALNRVAAPIGLDIGSETVDEIAISIVAELIAFRNKGRLPESLGSRAVWS
jgi:xanthine dehydrogenase accessory factor